MSIPNEPAAAAAPARAGLCAGPAEKLSGLNFAARLWKKDAGLWTTDPAAKKQISGALGWLDLPAKMLAEAAEITAFAESVRADGFTHAVLLGMGGSSLAPEVLKSVFQNPKYPRLHVLDTTDPAWISAVNSLLDLKRTLFIFASKSGGTIEPSSQFKYFWGLLKKAGVKRPGENFIAITDAGTGLEKLAREKNFLRTFLNPSDVGGRFSALSYFGLVPAALCGADVRKLLESAAQMAERCRAPRIEDNPGALLGALIAAQAGAGRDKLTLVMPEKFRDLGLWVEQLVAESTGKEGKGVVPVCQEPLMDPDKYQADRFFVRTALGPDAACDAGLSRLSAAGHPVYTITAADASGLGAEFFRWEVATAAAGAALGINPFDQPDVQAAKALTLEALKQYRAGGRAKGPRPDFSTNRVAVFASKALKTGGAEIKSYDDVFWTVFSGLKEKEYIGLLAYLPNAPLVEEGLKKLRAALTVYTSSACTLAYGPRYLHSSGQLHKGGPDNALFLILTNQAEKDIMIPGEKYTFWQLETAQALGDFEALDAKNRRILRLHLKHPLDRSLAYLSERIAKVGRPGGEPQAEAKTAEEREMPKIAVKKTTTTSKTAKTKLTTTEEYVVVDHPRNLENVTTGTTYAVRIGTSCCTGVDISINDQPWQPCRHAVGYWWFDWTNFPAGTHQLVARMHKPNGEYLISKRRRCKAA